MNQARLELRTSMGYLKDQKITEVLDKKTFTLSAEVIPPRNGQQMTSTMQGLQQIVGSGVDFLSVTKGAGGSLRGGSLPIAQTIKDHFSKPCIAHFTCRDLTPQDIENQLVDHHYFGVRNILALRGDPPMGETQWTPPVGGYNYAYQLMEQIQRLNQGEYLERKGFDVGSREATDFCIGAAVYPEHPDLDESLRFTQIKYQAGAEFGITQMIFDPLVYQKYVDRLSQLAIQMPVLPGVRILRSKKQAEIMKQRFGCSVPSWYSKLLPEEPSKEIDIQVLEPFLDMVDKLRKAGAPGIHIFVLSDVSLCQAALSELQRRHPS